VIPKPVGRRELADVAELLNAAFAKHRESMHFSADMLSVFAGWTWRLPGHSLALRDRGLQAVAMAGQRPATFHGMSLSVVHVGPVGVRPDRQRRGLASTLLRAVEDRAKRCDLLTLTTEPAYGAHRLYERLGYQVVERYRPSVVALGAAGWPPVEAARLSAGAFWKGASAHDGRPSAIVENTASAPPHVPALGPRYLRVADGAVATIDWPVVSRTGGTRHLKSTQVIAIRGPRRARSAVVHAAARAARAAGSEVLYSLPSVAVEHPRLRPTGPVVLRMAKALTPKGERALAVAAAWDEVCPAP